MMRRTIRIDEEKCVGCGTCAAACHEAAIGIIDGKARLLREEACDGLGNCLPSCPNGAITFTTKAMEKQWPLQLKLVSPTAPYFSAAQLLIAADCTAYAYPDFHQELAVGKTLVIACPKLDQVDYADKLTEIIRENELAGVSVVHMQVPCCQGIVKAVEQAIERSGKEIAYQEVIITTAGKRL